MIRLFAWRNLALTGVLALSLTAAFAADVNGRIRGTVTDPAGAVIPGAVVIATNQATGVKFTTKSNGSGEYLFGQLPVGTYTISSSVTGFKSFSASGIVLSIDQEYVESVKLAVGETSDVVEVQADTVQVNTTDMQLNNIVNAAQMEELPLIGRTFTGLELTLPGVQAPDSRFGGNYSVSGSQSQQSEYLINGADSNDIALNTLAIAPNLDAIDQFNLIDGPLNAEYDRNSGGIVSATIKQGTNRFHGDAFEFYRDTFLNTNNYFQKSATGKFVPVSPYHQNIFGGTIGGPILRDKLFFFGAYQGVHQRVPEGNGDATLYTASQLAGNFSNDLSSFSTVNTIPSTIAIPGCMTGQTWASCLVPKGGVVSASAFNPIATNLVNKYASPSLINSGSNGYLFNETENTTSNQEIGRFDYALNPKNQFTFLGIYFKQNLNETLPFSGATVPGFGDEDVETIQQYTFDYVRQISATTVNDFALHWTRFNYQAVIPQTPMAPSSVGFNINPENTAGQGLPALGIAGNGVNFELGFSTNGPQPRIDQVYQIDDNITKALGRHQLKFGYDGRRFNVSNPFSANNNGSYGFNTSGAFSTGDGALDFLLGIPATFEQGSGATIQAQAFLNYIYAQDSWKLTNSFTLDYGLGYSIDTPLQNHQYGGEGIACLIPGQQSKIFPTAPLGINYPGDSGGCNSAGEAYTRYTELGPRLGFAWAPDLGIISGSPGKFSIRGGFGIYYDRSEEETALQTLETPPFGLTSEGAADFGGAPQLANPYADINGGAGLSKASEPNKFPYVFPSKGQAIPYSTIATLEPFDISTFARNFRSPYAENFQVSVERELPSRTVVRASYVGSLARHNQITYEGNNETAAGHAACAAGTEFSPVLGASISCSSASNRIYQSYYFPNNTSAGTVDPNTGNPTLVSVGEVGSEASSSYNSAQLFVEKGVTHGLTFSLAYTYAHALDNGSSFENSGFGESSQRGYNQYDQALNYGDSTYDVRHRLVFAPIYVAPILHSHGVFSPLNLALSGWEVSGISTFATGQPFDVSYDDSTSDSLYCSNAFSFYACPDVPNQVAPLKKANLRAPRNVAIGGYTAYIAKTDFAPEVVGTFGDTHRNPAHGPGINNTNLILAKNFNLSSDGVRRLQIRMESDNAFNHTQFSNPGTTFTDSTLTTTNSTFGFVSSAAAARQTQLAAKFYF